MDNQLCLVTLSKRERECLFYIVCGKSAKSIAKILGISNRTVESYIEHLKEKFHCHNKADLIESAIKSGLVVISWHCTDTQES
jgi:DNA-binding CsgD family transcriptional regulator